MLRACEFFTTASDFPACHGIVSHPALFIEKFRILRLSFLVSVDKINGKEWERYLELS